MTLTEFINKYNGQFCDFDSYYGSQCVDLAQFYNRDVVGGPVLTGNAADIWTTYPKALYTQIANTPQNFPLPGDIVIWSGSLNGGPGHIAIAITADQNGFTSFDQNWPEGSHCHVQQHTYTDVLGWLHPTTTPQPPTPTDTLSVAQERDENWLCFVAVAQAAGVSADPAHKQESTQHAVTAIQHKDDQLTSLHGQLNTLQQQATDQATQLTTQIAQLQTQVAELTKERDDITHDRDEYIAANKTLNDKLSQMAEVVKTDAIEDSDVHTKLLDKEHEVYLIRSEFQKAVNLLISLFIRKKMK